MALSGTNTKTFSPKGYFRLRLVWSASQNIANNNSTVTATLYLDSTSGYAAMNDGTNSTTSITINGNKKTWNTQSDVPANGTKNLGSHSVTIGHNSDGTKTFSISASHYVDITWSGSFIGTVTTSGSHTLNTIPRASKFTRLDSFTIGGHPTISIGRHSSGFTHDITAKIGSTVIQTWTGQGLPTSLGFSDAADNALYSAIRNSVSATMTVTIQTKSGSTNIGSAVSRTCTVSVAGGIDPTFSSLSASEQVASVPGIVGSGRYVQNLSKVKFTINGAAGAKYSTIKSYKITFNGQTWNSSTGTTGVINKSGNVVATATVTDSRGRSASKSITVTLLPYGVPTLSKVTGDRAIAGGTLNGQGTYVKVTSVGAVSPLTVGGVQKNKRVLTINSRVKGTSAWTQRYTNTSTTASSINVGNVISGFSATSSYDIQVILGDYFNSATSTLTISTGEVTMSWGKSGVGIGKIHESSVGGALQVGGEAIFEGGVSLYGGINSIKIPPNADLNNYTNTGFYYNNSDADTRTMKNIPVDRAFSLLVERHAGYKQTYSRYDTGNPQTWTRNFYSGSWGTWRLVQGEPEILRLSLTNGWSNFGGVYAFPEYWKDSSNTVHLRGMIEGGGNKSAGTIATLPSGYKPLYREVFTVFAYNNQAVRVDVETNGNIRSGTTTQGHLSLSGISFVLARA